MSNPNKSHFQALNHIWKYLNNLGPKGLIFSPNKIDQSPPLVGYSDADWGGDLVDRKSTTGYYYEYSKSPIS